MMELANTSRVKIEESKKKKSPAQCVTVKSMRKSTISKTLEVAKMY